MNMQAIGDKVTGQNTFDKVTGGKGYPVNVVLPGMLHAKLLRSPYAHARVLSIDTSRAEKYPGVKAVLTAADVPQRTFHPVYFAPPESDAMVRDMQILSDRVRFTGQPVAAVAAVTPEIAEYALSLIDVEYEELTAVFTPEEALQEGAPQLHEHATGNVAKRREVVVGDVEDGFADADFIFEGTYETQRAHTCYMEPRLVVVDADREGHLTVHSSNQQIFGLREKLAYALEIPQTKVTVIKPPYIGGGFGGKLDLGYIEPIAALFSMRCRRPVRIEQSRYENFITNARHPAKVTLKTGIKKDGTFTARYIKSVMDAGGHATHGPMVMLGLGVPAALCYRCPNVKWEGELVYTNNILSGGYRGYGSPQAYFPVESQIDEICEEMGFDPIEFRQKNAHQEGDGNPYAPEMPMATYQYEQCLQQGADSIGWSQRTAAGAGAEVKKRGIGVATVPWWVSGCMGVPDFYEYSGAIVKMNPDGTAQLSTATIDLGAGQNTTLSQIAAEELGLESEQVTMTATGDTDLLPFDAPTHASRGTYCSGTAVKAAAAAARQRLLEVASGMMGVNAEDLEVKAGKVSVKNSPETVVTVADVVAYAESPLLVDSIDGDPVFISRPEDKCTIMGTASMAPLSNPSPATAEFVEVEVDTETGEVEILRVVYAHDIGKVINPIAAEGQVEGGFQQGMGYALMENLAFDQETGTCLASDFLDYKMPTSMEMPADIKCIFIESDEPSGPFGAKSLAECCLTVVAPAIANAIFNATGARVRDLPITPEKILRALGKL